MQKSRDLALLIESYKQEFGSYPNDLNELSQLLTIEQDLRTLDDLSFNKYRSNENKEWIYIKPKNMEEIVIISPILMPQHKGSQGGYIVARGTGNVEYVAKAKAAKIKDLLLEKGITVD